LLFHSLYSPSSLFSRSPLSPPCLSRCLSSGIPVDVFFSVVDLLCHRRSVLVSVRVTYSALPLYSGAVSSPILRRRPPLSPSVCSPLDPNAHTPKFAREHTCIHTSVRCKLCPLLRSDCAPSSVSCVSSVGCHSPSTNLSCQSCAAVLSRRAYRISTRFLSPPSCFSKMIPSVCHPDQSACATRTSLASPCARRQCGGRRCGRQDDTVRVPPG
jgi:hypothetical protein